MRKSQRLGQAGEEAAVRHLESRGYVVVARNWRPQNGMRGEIDCIAWDGQVLCFVEVKARSHAESAPQEAVTPAKRRQLSRLANAYVSLNTPDDVPCRFDVVEVWLADHKAVPRVALHANAFDYCGEPGD